MSFETPRARAQIKRILERLRLPGMVALYDDRGNIVAKAGHTLSSPCGLRVVNIGEGYRLCIQRASASAVGDRVERGAALLRRLLRGEEADAA